MNEEEYLTQEQEEYVSSKIGQVQHLIPSALKEEEVRKICIDFQFDQAKIDEYLSCYEIEEKYKDLEAF